MKILVTGGAGFIASHVADRYIELGHSVVILDNLTILVCDVLYCIQNILGSLAYKSFYLFSSLF